MLDAGSEGEGGALGLDVDGVGPRETLVTGGGLRGALIDEAGGLTLALWNTALGCSIIQGLKLLKKWFKSTDCLPSFLSASVPWVLSSEHQPQPGPASCRHEEQLGYLSRF